MRSSCCGTFKLSDLSRTADFLCDIPVLRTRRSERYQLSPFHLRRRDFKGGWERKDANQITFCSYRARSRRSEAARSPRPAVLSAVSLCLSVMLAIWSPSGDDTEDLFCSIRCRPQAWKQGSEVPLSIRRLALAANLRARQSEAQEFHAPLACAGGKTKKNHTDKRSRFSPSSEFNPSFIQFPFNKTNMFRGPLAVGVNEGVFIVCYVQVN